MAAAGPLAGGPLGAKSEMLGGATDNNPNSKTLLNTYIHNYFIAEGLGDLAKSLRESRLPVKTEFLSKEDASNGDTKEDGTMRTDGGVPSSENFLPNWWYIFWDMWTAARQKDKTDTTAAQYLAHTQRLRAQQQNAVLQNQNMIGNNFHRFNNMQPQQMSDLQKRGMTANGRMPTGMNGVNRLQQMNMQNQMQRDGTDAEMNGPQRGQSPMPSEAPSPKRQRLENGGFVPNGRLQGMPGQQPNGNAPNANMLMASSFDPQNAMSPNFVQQNGMAKGGPNAQQIYAQEMANHAKSGMVGIPKNPMGMPVLQQSSPMLATGPEGQLLPGDMFQPGPGNGAMRNQMTGTAGNGGALADYQMQLMLLEQQNKKRLMMARQEQDVAQRDHGGVGPQGLMGQPFAPNMSPRNSRGGHSPGSNAAKHSTPRLGQDSPLPDASGMTGRASPAPGFDPNQMQGNLNFQMVGGPNGMQLQRPNGPGPSQQQLEMMRRQGVGINQGPWPPGMHGPGQMLPQGIGGMQLNQGDNNPRNIMPPPQGPANGRTQPPSPQQSNAAPPTPSQGNKAANKKKDPKEKPKKQTKKNTATTAATPSEVEAADEVPPTPTSPHNKLAGLIKGTNPGKGNAPPPSQPVNSMPTNNTMNMGMSQDNPMVPPFGSLSDGNDMPTFDNFEDLLSGDNSDVLNGFDFEAFMHNEPIPGGFDFDGPFMNGDNPLETMGE